MLKSVNSSYWSRLMKDYSMTIQACSGLLKLWFIANRCWAIIVHSGSLQMFHFINLQFLLFKIPPISTNNNFFKILFSVNETFVQISKSTNFAIKIFLLTILKSGINIMLGRLNIIMVIFKKEKDFSSN